LNNPQDRPALRNQDSLQRGLRPGGARRFPERQLVFLSETRTRFKEDCDRERTDHPRHHPNSPKPGLASKRIATSCTSVPAAMSRQYSETRTRFKEDCDFGSEKRLNKCPRLRNQDSLQRGLRRANMKNSAVEKINRISETRTRFKEDCDSASRWRPPCPWVSLSETRTRFKEDCDTRRSTIQCPQSGSLRNQDSLQRGLRRRGQ